MIPLRLTTWPEGDQSGYDKEPGDVWLCHNYAGSHTVPGRGPCWIVRLPGRAAWWHSNMEASEGGYWTVTGEWPNVSVSPSINVGPEIWHGHITDGSLSPDVSA